MGPMVEKKECKENKNTTKQNMKRQIEALGSTKHLDWGLIFTFQILITYFVNEIHVK